MNQFNLKQTKGSPATIEMDVSTDLLDRFKNLFDIEIELMQGEHTDLGEGMHRHKFQVEDPIKLAMIKDFLNMLMQHPSMKVKIMGLDVNPN